MKTKNYFDDIVGQNHIKPILTANLISSQQTGIPVGHLLFCGQAGLGKTFFARKVAEKIGKPFYEIVAGSIKDMNSVVKILKKVNEAEGTILFIDEIHRLPMKLEEVLYPVMQDFCIYIQGESDSEVKRYDMKKFTLIGGTTLAGNISKPLRDRFLNIFNFQYYTNEELQKIIQQENSQIAEDIAFDIACRSQNTPRIAKKILYNCINYAISYNDGAITKDVIDECLEDMEIDIYGLGHNERIILQFLAEIKKPVGIDVLSVSTSIEKMDIINIHEPYLSYIGFIMRTPKGRVITKKGKKAIGIDDGDINSIEEFELKED